MSINKARIANRVKIARILGLVLLLLFLSVLFSMATCNLARAEETTRLDRLHEGLTYTHYGVSLLDGYTAGKGIQNGAVEGGSFANMMMPRDRALIIPRMALAGATAYGFEALIGYGWRRDRSRQGRILLLVTQGALIGLSCHSVSVQFKFMK